MPKRDPALYLQDIADCVKKIEKYTKGVSFEKFSRDSKTIDAVVRNIEIIGEASKNIPAEMRRKYTGISWPRIIGMRNVISHEYFGVLPDIIWKTIKDDLPKLKSELKIK